MRVVDVGVYNLLNADATLVSLGSTGAYRQVIPQAGTFPAVVFQQMSGVDEYTFAGRSHVRLLYLAKAVTTGASASTAEQMADRIDTVMTDGSLAVSGYTVQRVRRSTHVTYTEIEDGVTYNHAGGVWQIDLAA